MNAKVWYLPYLEDVYHTQMIETFANDCECLPYFENVTYGITML